jgi:predicted ribosome quality control (RQC) complex YloA/Tae2 family protein
VSLNAAEVEAVVRYLGEALAGGQVRAVRAVADDPQRFVLRVRSHGVTHDVVIDVNERRCRVHTVEVTPPSPQVPSAFVMLARSRAEGARILSVGAYVGDRIVRIDVDGEQGRAAIIVELFDRGGNAYVVDADDRILGALVPLRGERDARLADGLYRPPEPGARHVDLRGLRDGWPATGDPGGFLGAVYEPRASHEALEFARLDAMGRIDRAIRKLARRRAALERDAAKVDEAEAFKQRGDLLQAAWGSAARGASFVEVPNYFVEGAPIVRIELDPAKSFQQNVERLYHEHRRMARGAERVLERILLTDAEESELRAARTRIADAVAVDAIARFVAELERRRLLGRPPAPAARNRPVERQPYRVYRSTDGLAILVGRTDADNDALTFRVARGNDVWLHARDWPGSHVVVRAPRDGAIPHRTLDEAAWLAAKFSRGSDDGIVTVTWTQRKNVRKPRGVKAGSVSVAAGKSVDVRTDDARLGKVLEALEPMD